MCDLSLCVANEIAAEVRSFEFNFNRGDKPLTEKQEWALLKAEEVYLNEYGMLRLHELEGQLSSPNATSGDSE